MLKLALPKGSLEEQTLRLFEQADLPVKKEFRGYNPIITDPRISQVKILRPQEIPKYIEEGYFDLGIAGVDCVLESEADVELVADLPYSKQSSDPVRMVIAVSEESDISKPADIPSGSRVSTEFPNLTKKFFDEIGVAVKVSYSYGATEAKIPELMDVVVDLTETGETLRKNRLKIIGSIIESTTKLIANKESWRNPGTKKAIEEIRTLLTGVIEARGKVLLSMNIPKTKLDDLVNALPAMKKPTIAELYGHDYYAVETVVQKSEVNILIPELKKRGAEDILELDIQKVVR
ncbi:MAG: ATP phosphoribosyltransferase [Terriglobia bacterium]